MIDDDQTSASDEYALTRSNGEPRWPMIVALAFGIVAALLSISLEYSRFSTSETVGYIIIVFVFPGILGSVAVAGNVHAYSLWVAAGVNCAFYFVIVRIICGILIRISRKIP